MKRLLGFLLVISSLAWAGDGAGNGDVVRCDNGSLQLLDFFESHVGLAIVLGGSSLSITQKALFAIDRIKNLDPDRYHRYHEMAESFLDKSRFVTGPLFDYKDTGPLALPPNCHLEQVAIQRPPIDPSDKPFTIDVNEWAALPNDDQRAGVILHETTLHDTLALGQQTSELARRYTALLASDTFEHISQADYQTLTENIFQAHQPRFVSNIVSFQAKSGEPFLIHLSSLLATDANSNLNWNVTEDMPQWLKLNSQVGEISGTPEASDVGSSQFDLVVRDQQGQALALVQLQVTL